MGMQTVFKKQVNPDGKYGHDERLEIYHNVCELQDKNQPKQKFTGGAAKRSEFVEIQRERDCLIQKESKKHSRDFNTSHIKKRCANYKKGCNPNNCKVCKKKVRIVHTSEMEPVIIIPTRSYE